MKLNKLLIYPLIFFVILTTSCNKNNVTQPEVSAPESIDCPITSPSTLIPINFIAQAYTLNQVQLLWRPISPATTYKIYKNNQFLVETPLAQYVDNFELEQNMTYEYKVVASSTAGSSRKSPVSYFKGALSGSVQEDIKNFTLTEDSWINMITEVSGTLSMYSVEEKTIKILDAASGNEIHSSFGIDYPHGETGSIYFPLKAGNYAIKLKRISGEGDYILHNYFLGSLYNNDSEPNDVFANAIPLTLNSLRSGHLGFTGADNSFDGKDIYKFTLDKKMTLGFAIYVEGTLNLAGNTLRGVTIYNNNGVTIADQFNGPSGSEDISLNRNINLEAGTYYIMLSRIKGFGGYEFKLCTGN